MASASSASLWIGMNACTARPSSEGSAGETSSPIPSTEGASATASEIASSSLAVSSSSDVNTAMAGMESLSLNSPSSFCTWVASADSGR